MSLLTGLDLDRFGPARLWRALDPEVRELAARAMFTSEDPEIRTEAQLALAQQLRFRPQFVQKLPVDKRVGYLARQVRPDDNLAGSLLLALHLGERRPVLAAFLDALGVEHDDGLLADDADLGVAEGETLDRAVAAIEERFPAEDVELYLASLFALDRETWSGLRGVLERRAGA